MAKGIVAAGHELTVQAAEDILNDGGNAFDAAIAACYAACIVEPVLASPGGGGFLLARPLDGRPMLYDFFVHTPARRGTDDIDFTPILADFGETRQEFHIGRASSAVPGVVRGLFQVHDDLARMPMRQLVAPALGFSRQGVPVNAFQAYIFDIVSPIFLCQDTSRRVYAGSQPHTGLLAEGDRYHARELADTLEAIAIEGERLFYQGEISALIAGDCAAGGGLLTRDDLRRYQCIRRKPLQFTYRDWTLLTNPPPSSGGVLIAFALKLLEQFDVGAMAADGIDKLLSLVAVMELTQQARLDHHLELDQLQALLDEQLLAAYLQDVRHRARAYRGTTHVSIIDAQGNMASMTLSNGEGCGYMLDGTGIMLNNMLGEQDLNPRGFFSWQPDQRMTSMMAPSLMLGPDGRHLVTGSGGSNRIRSALLQVISNVVDHRMSIEQAVAGPRLHFEDGLLQVEALFDVDVLERLKESVEACKLWPQPNLFFGGAHTVMQQGRDFSGAGDGRRGGDCRKVS